MSKSAFVTVYRLEIEATHSNLDKMEAFIEAISDYCIVSNDQLNVAIVAACDESMSMSEISNQAIEHFGYNNYQISSLGMLGPFKKSH